jgi:hypothetical protein
MIQVTFLKDHTMFIDKNKVHISAKQQKRLSKISLAKDKKISMDNLEREIKAGRITEPAPAKVSIPSDYHDGLVKKGIIESSRKKTTKKKK